MTIATICLSILLVAAGAAIFWLLKVLKNTFRITTDLLDMTQGKGMEVAYDGQYYPATVIAQTLFSQPQEMMVTDFSRYEDKKIVGFTICTTESIQEHYQKEGLDLSEEEINEIFGKPVVIKNAIVYAPREGMWTWKS